MTKKELKALMPGDIVCDKKHGLKFELVKVCTYNTVFYGKVFDLLLKPIDGQDYRGLYEFKNNQIYINSKRMKK